MNDDVPQAVLDEWEDSLGEYIADYSQSLRRAYGLPNHPADPDRYARLRALAVQFLRHREQ